MQFRTCPHGYNQSLKPRNESKKEGTSVKRIVLVKGMPRGPLGGIGGGGIPVGGPPSGGGGPPVGGGGPPVGGGGPPVGGGGPEGGGGPPTGGGGGARLAMVGFCVGLYGSDLASPLSLSMRDWSADHGNRTDVFATA